MRAFGIRASAEEYRAFFTVLGFEIPSPQPSQTFDPLFHEIRGADVGTWAPKDGIVLGRNYWPLVRFGEMVFSRAGVDVSCQPGHGIVKSTAERSTLYFANDRFNRPARDLSHDWGSNSRWRTRFARCYRTSAYAIFNADGRVDLSGQVVVESGPSSQFNLPIAARRELLVNRCFVSHADDEIDGDRFPYDDVLVVRAPSGWPLDEHALVPLDGLAL